MSQRIRVNTAITAPELRVIGPKGENIGVISREEALRQAAEQGFDLIEISPTATPPVAKIMDYGKWQYAEAKKQKLAKSKSRQVEVKSLQIKIGTGEHDLSLKARKASEWLKEGHRIKIDLFLPGRAKYLDQKFLKERLNRFLNLITEGFIVTDSPKKSPKGLTAFVERAKKENQVT